MVVGATYAYFKAQGGTGSSTEVKVTAYTTDVFTFTTGDAINIYADQSTFASGKGNAVGSTFAKATLTANNKTNTATEHYYVYLNISNNSFTYSINASTPELILTVIGPDGNEVTNIEADWAAKIAETTWKVGGNTWKNFAEVIPSVAYQNEIVSPVTTNATDNATTYSAKVGLMYVSDYGFAAAPSVWTRKLAYGSGDGYSNDAVRIVNWMFMGINEVTISRCADDDQGVFVVYGDGASDLFSYAGDAFKDWGWGVRPVFYLSSSVTYVSGS